MRFRRFYGPDDSGAGSSPANTDSLVDQGGADAGLDAGEDGDQDGLDLSGVGEDGGTTGKKGPVPYDRFFEANERGRRAEARVIELERENAVLAKKPAARVDGEQSGGGDLTLADLPPPPANLTKGQQISWYVTQVLDRHADVLLPRYLERLGLPVDALKGLAGASDSIRSTTAETEWLGICKAGGIQDSPLVRAAFRGLMAQDQDATPEEIMAAIKQMAPKAAPPTRQPATQIPAGRFGNFTEERILPRDKAHAGQLALQGKRVPDVGIFDALDAADKRRVALGRRR